MKQLLIFILSLSCLLINFADTKACSTFKLQKEKHLIYGHNLNEGDIGVPGLIFINKRGIFKNGRTWSEITTKNKENPSSHCWISKYGSVTFNNFAKDFPDGGMNEVGLYIWEMNDQTEYPSNNKLPKLNQMNWMQYILDNFSTLDEAINSAYEFEIDGWGWHFFIGDAQGNTAAVEFIDGKVVIHKNDEMPVPGLFNEPYKRELELLKYYKGYGGKYEIDYNSPEVPRFAKTAKLISEFDPSMNPIDYGFNMLKTIQVSDVPEWSILFDVKNMNVYFRTRLNPEIKSFSMNSVYFSNTSPTQILNLDIKKSGDVLNQFHQYTNQKMVDFYKDYMLPILPEEFFTKDGITIEEYLHRISSHSEKAALKDNQYFLGNWESVNNDKLNVFLKFESSGDAIKCKVWSSKNPNKLSVDHLQLIGNKFSGTIKNKKNRLIEIKGIIENDKINLKLFGIENKFGDFYLTKN